jgi:hypothetical protein
MVYEEAEYVANEGKPEDVNNLHGGWTEWRQAPSQLKKEFAEEYGSDNRELLREYAEEIRNWLDPKQDGERPQHTAEEVVEALENSKVQLNSI